MHGRAKTTFLILVLLQGLHSIEEYLGRLWEVFTPARILTGLISENHETGFLIANIGLFVFGIWCWLVPVRQGHRSAYVLMWFWIVLETINGIGHPVWSLSVGGYTPGVVTAVALFFSAIYLAALLLRQPSRRNVPSN